MALTNRRPDQWPDQSGAVAEDSILFGEVAPADALGTNVGVITIQAIANLVIALIVDGSPAALDTLNELAAALGDNPNFATDVLAAIAAKAAANEPFVTTVATGGLSGETPIGSIILAPGLAAGRPAANTVPAGALYFATDTFAISRSTGAAWVAAASYDAAGAAAAAQAAAIAASAPVGSSFITTAADGGLSAETPIGSVILAPDVIANRPAANTVAAGAIYLSTDTKVLARSTGAAWVVMVDLSGTYAPIAVGALAKLALVNQGVF